MSHARDERLALCRLLIRVGPDAPTLCAGWTTRDLAAHLVVRERRPDSAIGIAGPLSGYAEGVRVRTRDGTPYQRLVEMLAQGPPVWTPWGAIPGMDANLNLVEFFVHHEDVRRGGSEWHPRDLTPDLERVLWSRLGMARLVLRRAPTGVRLRWSSAGRPDGPERIVRKGEPPVTVAGSPAELTLWALGRTSVAEVELTGDDAAVDRLRSASWSM